MVKIFYAELHPSTHATSGGIENEGRILMYSCEENTQKPSQGDRYDLCLHLLAVNAAPFSLINEKTAIKTMLASWDLGKEIAISWHGKHVVTVQLSTFREQDGQKAE